MGSRLRIKVSSAPQMQSPAGESGQVVAVAEKCLRDAAGSWQVTVHHSGVLAHCWILEIARAEDGASGLVLIELGAADPARRLRRALAAMGALPPQPTRPAARVARTSPLP
jgi:hypothetical protein